MDLASGQNDRYHCYVHFGDLGGAIMCYCQIDQNGTVIAVVDKIMIMGQQGLWYIGGTLKMQGDDIIFPNLDMCLITLAGWFNESLLKKNWNPRCNF